MIRYTPHDPVREDLLDEDWFVHFSVVAAADRGPKNMMCTWGRNGANNGCPPLSLHNTDCLGECQAPVDGLDHDAASWTTWNGALVRLELEGEAPMRPSLHAVTRSDAPPGPAGRWLLQRLGELCGKGT